MNRVFLAAVATVALALSGCGKKEQDPKPVEADEPAPVTITGVRWDERKDDGTGTLYVQASDGSELLVETGAIDSWFSQDRTTLYYTYRHGLSGFEREGMGVKRFAISDKVGEVVFDHDLIVLHVQEVLTKSGRKALVVEMIDGGRGAPEVAVADPERGRVFIAERSRTVGVLEGTLTIGRFTDEQIDSAEFFELPKPDTTEDLDLDGLLGQDATRDTPNPIPAG